MKKWIERLRKTERFIRQRDRRVTGGMTTVSHGHGNVKKYKIKFILSFHTFTVKINNFEC